MSESKKPEEELLPRILITDDQEDVHNDFRRILLPQEKEDDDLLALEAELLGESGEAEKPLYTIDSAFQGEESIKKIRAALEEGQQSYSVVFMDVRMPPGQDGVVTTQQVLEIDQDIQVVFCTAYSDYDWPEMTKGFSTSDRVLFLKKPFDPVEVRQIVVALTKKWSLTRESRARVESLEEGIRSRTEVLAAANERLTDEMAQRSKLEVELRLAQKLEAVGQLAAGIAHEINTPIQYIGDNLRFLGSVIESYRELLEVEEQLVTASAERPELEKLVAAAKEKANDVDVEYLEEEAPRALEQALDGVKRVSDIVLAMKKFSHPGSEEKSLVDINKALQATAIVASNEWKYVAEVEFNLSDELPAVNALEGELNQVFLNIMVNAAHAIADIVAKNGGKGRITISTFPRGEEVEVRFQDTGGGVPEAIREKIFTPFFTTKAVGKGTGQGLALARNVIVERHSGKLELESEMGVGTTFSILLPIREVDAVDESRKAVGS